MSNIVERFNKMFIIFSSWKGKNQPKLRLFIIMFQIKTNKSLQKEGKDDIIEKDLQKGLIGFY